MFDKLFNRQKGPLQLHIEGREDFVEIPPKTTILKAALDAGLPFPHSCRAGGCASCKCRLVSGKVKELTDKSYLLSAEELRSNFILACQSIPRSDVTIAVELGADSTKLTATEGRIARTRYLTHDIMEVTLALKEAMSYRAGQYADLSVPGAVSSPRSYSFARAPHSEQLTEAVFHVRLIPGGELSGWLAGSDRSGETVRLEGPFGDFWLREGNEGLLCLAGGTGMAPLKALLEQALEDRVQRDVLYLFGARSQRDLYCLEEMERFAEAWPASFQFIPVLSEEPENSGWQGRRGLVTEHLAEFDLAGRHAYMCGPPPMLDAAMECLKTAGLSASNIHFDKFLDRSHVAR